VVEILNAGGQFADSRDLVAGTRGRTVYELGDAWDAQAVARAPIMQHKPLQHHRPPLMRHLRAPGTVLAATMPH
jgi:hypothetical protein